MYLQTSQYVLNRARVYLGDVLESGITPKFTDEELVDFLNDGLDDIQEIKRKLFRTFIVLDLEKLKRTYDVSDHLVNIRRVSYKDTCRMGFSDYKEMDKQEKSWATRIGLPTKIIYDYTNPQLFSVYPIPQDNDYQALVIYGDRKLKPLTVSELDELLDIDDRLYKPLIHYIVSEASTVKSVNTEQCDAAKHRQRYEFDLGKINLKKSSQDTGAELYFDYNTGFDQDSECFECNNSDIKPDTILYFTVPVLKKGIKLRDAVIRKNILTCGLNLIDFIDIEPNTLPFFAEAIEC